LSAVLVLAAASAQAQSGNEWPMYGGDYANTRYSSLTQINTGNVNRLRVAWMRSLGSLESQEATPIVVGDTMYVSTSTGPPVRLCLQRQGRHHEVEVRARAAERLCGHRVLRPR
jgi:glucose dehydrogenase